MRRRRELTTGRAIGLRPLADDAQRREDSPVSAPVLLFDGDCNLCNGTVRFVLRHERSAEFRFAPLQSPVARELLASTAVDAADRSSVLVLDKGLLYRESDAIVQILARLNAPWRWLRHFSLVSRPVRNRVYRFIGERRYRWWGRAGEGHCALPTPEMRSRFLQ